MSTSTITNCSIALIGLLGTFRDISTLYAFTILRNRSSCQDFLQKHVHSSTFAIAGGCVAVLLTIAQITRYIRGFCVEQFNKHEAFLKPMFFPTRTSHMRLFPKRHAFSYSYLLTGIPVGWTGSIGGMISTDEEKDTSPWYWKLLCLQPSSPWYVVNGDDYLERGYVPGGLEGKLKKFLQDNGLKHEDFPYAYLMTSSRFLGYQNNPVSIWNLYSGEKELKAMILEVNNTFDERHIYLVTPRDIEASEVAKTAAKAPRFTNTWSKEFYVSPFNIRNGSYSISASDPFFPSLTGSNPIDLTLTLSSSERPFLVARLFSAGSPLDPSKMSILQKTRFLFSWWWVGFATFPRTLVQAWKLFFKRKMPWISRPEPLKVTISKHADATEKYLEGNFRQYLRNLVVTTDLGIRLKYKPAGLLNNSEEVVHSPSAQSYPSTAKELEVTVLTPIFYTQFVKYTDVLAALESEANNETIFFSNRKLLSSLLSQEQQVSKSRQLNWLKRFFFQIIRSRGIHTTSETTPLTNQSSVLSDVSLLSSFDQYMLSSSQTLRNPSNTSSYIKILTKIFLSDYVALGWIEILELECFLLRCGFLWWMAGKLGW